MKGGGKVKLSLLGSLKSFNDVRLQFSSLHTRRYSQCSFQDGNF